MFSNVDKVIAGVTDPTARREINQTLANLVVSERVWGARDLAANLRYRAGQQAKAVAAILLGAADRLDATAA